VLLCFARFAASLYLLPNRRAAGAASQPITGNAALQRRFSAACAAFVGISALSAIMVGTGLVAVVAEG
jgi:hypothetical protein